MAPCSPTSRSRSGSRRTIRCGGFGSLRIRPLIGSTQRSASSMPQKAARRCTQNQLLLASLLQAFYGIRPECLLLDQPHYNLMFRWFVRLSPDDLIWHPTTFTKNRDRCLNEYVLGRFLQKLKNPWTTQIWHQDKADELSHRTLME